jgi:death on curing protein
MTDPHKLRHPSIEQVLRAHQKSIQTYGTSTGLFDHRLLASALAAPKQSLRGQLLHSGPAEIAAAYLFHLCMNHPFVDGNKRIGLLAALLFLDANGYTLTATPAQAEAITMKVAASQCSKQELTQWFKKHISQP